MIDIIEALLEAFVEVLFEVGPAQPGLVWPDWHGPAQHGPGPGPQFTVWFGRFLILQCFLYRSTLAGSQLPTLKPKWTGGQAAAVISTVGYGVFLTKHGV